MKSNTLHALMVLSFAAFTVSCAPASTHLSSELPDDETQEEINPMTEEEYYATKTIEELGFEEVGEVTQQVSRGLAAYAYVDPQGMIPDRLRTEALAYFDKNQSRIKNKNYVSVIDFSLKSSVPRFFIINMNTGSVTAIRTAHGTGSDSDHDGYAEKFSNVSGSNASSLGFYLTAETYSGKHGYSLRLDGLSSTNSRARSRAVVIHGATYVKDSDVKAGRSWGCPAISMANRTKVIDMIRDGSLIYAGLSK